MPRLTAEQWGEARALRESGMSLTEVAAKMGIDRAAVSRRAKREAWSDGSDIGDAVRRRVTERVTGIVTSRDPKKVAEAIDAEAARAAAVVERHRHELEEHAALFAVAEIKANFEVGKSAKISAEMLAIRQKAERIAWNLDDNSLKIDISKATDAELEAIVKGGK
jgi:hypothetical protein